MNLQHEFCVTFVNPEKREKNAQLHWLFFRFEILWRGTKTSWEHVKVNAAQLFGLKVSVNYSEVSPKQCQLLFVSQYQSTEKLVRERVWSSWEFRFLENSGIGKLCLLAFSDKKIVSRFCQKFSSRSIKFFCKRDWAQTRTHENQKSSFTKIFGTARRKFLTKIVIKSFSGVREFLFVLGIDCTYML